MGILDKTADWIADKIEIVEDKGVCGLVKKVEDEFKPLIAAVEEPFTGIARIENVQPNGRKSKFSRIFPLGNAVLTLPADLALWSATGALSSPGQNIDHPGFSITLDPEWTTPGAVVFVHTGDAQQAVALRPGETIRYDEGFNSFSWWNALGPQVAMLSNPDFKPFGWIAFLVGAQPGDAPEYVRTVKARSLVSATQWIEPPAPGAIYDDRVVIASGIKGIRISFFPNGNNLVDFTAVMRPYVAAYGSIAGAQALPPPINPVFPQPYNGTVPGWFWFPAGELDMTLSNSSLTFQREVQAESLMWGITRVSMSGGDTTRVYASIEVYS